MKEFFLILFFSKIVLLTPESIDLIGEVTLHPEEPLKAITSGASLQIDVASMTPWDGKEDIFEFRKRLAGHYPSDTITAKLLNNNSNLEVTLIYKGNYSFNKESVTLDLYHPEGMPTDFEFDKVVITSRIELKGVKVMWKNYKH